MLAERFGLDDYTTKEPVFSDVGQEEACYTALQSCADWEIVDKGESGEFYPDTEVQADFGPPSKPHWYIPQRAVPGKVLPPIPESPAPSAR